MSITQLSDTMFLLYNILDSVGNIYREKFKDGC